MIRSFIPRLGGLALSLALAPITLAQGPAQTYHLRPGSTDQQGCFLGCACFTSLQEPFRGTFVLTSVSPQSYVISDVQFRAPSFRQAFVGTGTYQVGAEPAAFQRMHLDLTIDSGTTTLHWDSGIAAPSPLPVITSTLTINNYQCYDIVLTLRATPLRSDWVPDGAVTIGDLFAFLNDWFAGDGDENEDGGTDMQDIFAFLGDWFADV
jgi:hypothetical protein